MTFSFAPNPWATSQTQDIKESHDMDPKDHVKLNSETGMHCVYDSKGSKIKEFKEKSEAEAWAVKNHDSLMVEALKGDQHELDHDGDGDIDGDDFKKLRGKKKKSSKSKTEDEPEGENGETADMNPKMKSEKVGMSENNPAWYAMMAKHNEKERKEKGLKPMPNLNDPKFKMTKKDKMTKDPKNPTGAMTGYRSKMDHVEKEENMSIREKLLSVVERKDHGAHDNHDDWDEKYTGAGAKKMRKDHQNMKVDTTRALGVKDASTANRASKSAAPRNGGDHTKSGDRNIIKPGTSMKDPAASKEKALENVMAAYNSMYDEDVLSENILSKLPGAHGRYMKKLKVAHDHHMNMHQGHNSMEHKIDPSHGADDDANTDPDRQVSHGFATMAHHEAAQSIKKLAVHAKKNKLTDHPKGINSIGKKLHNQAKSHSEEAHSMSHDALEHDNAEARTGNDSHIDHTVKLGNHVFIAKGRTYKADSAHKHL